MSRWTTEAQWNTRPIEDALRACVEALEAENERLRRAVEIVSEAQSNGSRGL